MHSKFCVLAPFNVNYTIYFIFCFCFIEKVMRPAIGFDHKGSFRKLPFLGLNSGGDNLATKCPALPTVSLENYSPESLSSPSC